MSIFIASTKSISRGKGQSAVASASYRAGEKLYDERYGKTHDYTGKGKNGVMSAELFLPDSLKDFKITREELWNLAEQSEKRKDARVAREWLINLSHELDEQARQNLAHKFTKKLVERYGVIADCAIHRPTQQDIEKGADPRNFHAHVMLTTRQAELKNGKLVLEKKADSELSDADRKKQGLCKMSDEVKQIRELWETLANEELAEHNLELIDRRSYAELGIDKIAQVKMGAAATALERDGKRTAKGDINREILEYNELVFNRELEYIEQTNRHADEIIFESRKQHERAEQQREQRRITDNRIFFASQIEQQSTQLINRTTNSKFVIGETEQQIARAEQIFDTAEQRVTNSKFVIGESKQRIAESNTVIDKYTQKQLRIKEEIRQALLAQQEQEQAAELERQRQEVQRRERLEQQQAEQKRLAELERERLDKERADELERQRREQLEQQQAEQARLAELERQRREQLEQAEQQRLKELAAEHEQIRKEHQIKRFWKLVSNAKNSDQDNDLLIEEFKKNHTPLSPGEMEQRRKFVPPQDRKALDFNSLDDKYIRLGKASFSILNDGTFAVNSYHMSYDNKLSISKDYFDISEVCEIDEEYNYLTFKKFGDENGFSIDRQKKEFIKNAFAANLEFKQLVNEQKFEQKFEPKSPQIGPKFEEKSQKNDDYGPGF